MEALPLKFKDELSALLSGGEKSALVVGTSSILSLALWLSRDEIRLSGGRPHLLVLPKTEDLEAFKLALEFFSPKVKAHELPAFDVSPYSNLYPSRRLVAQRLNWLYRAQHAQAGELFITTLPALLQRTLPFDVMAQSCLSLKLGQELPPELTRHLDRLGYIPAPVVEDVGSYAFRGGILDIFSPGHEQPVRLELFGDQIDSLRFFDPDSQRSLSATPSLDILPAREVLFNDENRQSLVKKFNDSIEGRAVDSEDVQALRYSLSQGQFVHGLEFLVAYFYKTPALPAEHFSRELTYWRLDPLEIERSTDTFLSGLKFEFEDSLHLAIRPHYQEMYAVPEGLNVPKAQELTITKIQVQESFVEHEQLPRALTFSTAEPLELIQRAKALNGDASGLAELLEERLLGWRREGYRIFVACSTAGQAQRLRLLLERGSLQAVTKEAEDFSWQSWLDEQDHNGQVVHLLSRNLPESQRLANEQIIFLREEDLFGRKARKRETKTSGTLEQRVNALSFGDLKVGDFIVHRLHGVGIYEGLRVMPIQGVDAEFIQLKYKDNDKLYLPVYRVGQIQKYSGPGSHVSVDKLGGTGWEKTKTKVRAHLRDLASDLLKLYATRAQLQRPPFSPPDDQFAAFESSFSFEETVDQQRAIQDVIGDMTRERPMDRLICGDVGFGKTEVAMRAAFKAVQDGRQVAMIAPTTVLTFQHLENFKKRFAKWPFNIRSLNRFVPPAEAKKTLQELKEGKVDLLIGTHRLLSKDVAFKNLGLLIVDEEQKFGVTHKERLRKLKTSVDTMSMSATPIPRTLNMGLMGLRDLSIINTPPVDRLPTRTFVAKFDGETIRKAVYSEIGRGGQVFFIHNRIHSIYELSDRLRELLPDVRLKVAHGQMEEDELEKVMIAFFHHEIDILVCTAIVESGMDIPKANTMFIDNAQQFGLSQLYQLRGRVGRSKERAYCYLLVPQERKLDAQAQERLKVLQENTALGSGFKIAHYDLELRGAGDLLGEEQSGHVGAVGYELYLELLEEAVHEVKGEKSSDSELDPEINVRIQALIPDKYIPDIRVRLSYYKVLSEIESPEEVDRIEEELRDQFGKPPPPVLNLLGLMAIRRLCKDLGVRDLSSGVKSISLAFTSHTPLPSEKVVELASRQNKKYSVTPDHRLNVRMNELEWARIYDELLYLKSLC